LNKKGGLMPALIKRLDGRVREVMLFILLGILIVCGAWLIFHADDEKDTSLEYVTDTEMKVLRLLEEMDGVGDANVIVYEDNGGVESVVVVCEGARNLQVVMNVREAVASALGTDEKSVKIYLKQE
jgi:hypothetical protein